MSDPVPKPYKDVRALQRGLRVLEAVGEFGWAKAGALSTYTGIDRATIYRLVETLIQMGYLQRRSEDQALSLTSKIAEIGDAVRDDDIVAQTIAPYLFELTESVLWPSDFGGLSRGILTIRVSTHRHSPLTFHRKLLNREQPLTRSALGKAILAAMSENELSAALSAVAGLGGQNAEDTSNERFVRQIIQTVRETGYAYSEGTADPKVSAIAQPVMWRNRVVGAVNIVFFRSAMTTREAADKYLADLKECVAKAEQALAKQVITL